MLIFAAAEGPLAADTFFHLTTAGRIGLLVVAILIAGLTIFCARLVHKRLRALKGAVLWMSHIITGVVFLWLFEWWGPQLFYFYFMQLFSYLPLQIVIAEPPTPETIGRLLTFTAATEQNGLSRYSAGVLGWILIAQGLWFARKQSTSLTA